MHELSHFVSQFVSSRSFNLQTHAVDTPPQCQTLLVGDYFFLVLPMSGRLVSLPRVGFPRPFRTVVFVIHKLSSVRIRGAEGVSLTGDPNLTQHQ
jgi:hypothetical protein